MRRRWNSGRSRSSLGEAVRCSGCDDLVRAGVLCSQRLRMDTGLSWAGAGSPRNERPASESKERYDAGYNERSPGGQPN